MNFQKHFILFSLFYCSTILSMEKNKAPSALDTKLDKIEGEIYRREEIQKRWRKTNPNHEDTQLYELLKKKEELLEEELRRIGSKKNNREEIQRRWRKSIPSHEDVKLNKIIKKEELRSNQYKVTRDIMSELFSNKAVINPQSTQVIVSLPNNTKGTFGSYSTSVDRHELNNSSVTKVSAGEASEALGLSSFRQSSEVLSKIKKADLINMITQKGAPERFCSQINYWPSKEETDCLRKTSANKSDNYIIKKIFFYSKNDFVSGFLYKELSPKQFEDALQSVNDLINDEEKTYSDIQNYFDEFVRLAELDKEFADMYSPEGSDSDEVN